ncbi:hypothetical protein [Kitasatospora sp. NPDC008115]|uniref:hypothetical protein n=1 Tax=Kitasatospora sp. NPDC008115 TaxID=3364022 RepID=UPI0036E04AC9
MDEGGEPACWLDRVCDECGRLRERSGPGPCEHCGGGARTAGADEPEPEKQLEEQPEKQLEEQPEQLPQPDGEGPGNGKSPWADHLR